MSLVPGVGVRIGPYEIVASLGAGGMGEVYRARDTRLKRDVALKFLPEAVAADPERLARFEREAQALAALKHPRIAAIHGIEESGGVRALVLELAEGETLADRLSRGAVPVADAVAMARQIVDALEAAHEQGIVHRDLKPANIQIAPNGDVKILDFGLARIVDAGDGALTGATRLDSMSPTITSPALLTGQSVLMGTAAYMSPEQARGKPADKRSDIWAFGVVLYEMLTGVRGFVGETVTEVAGAVIHKDLDLTALPANTPDAVRLLLRRCLQKDPRQRIRDMGDVRLMLDGAFDVPAASATRQVVPNRSRVFAIASAAALIAAAIAAAVVWTMTRTVPVARFPVRVNVPAPARGTIQRVAFALSPNGRYLAYVAPDPASQGHDEDRLWVYSFADGQSRRAAPDDVGFTPLWSPDSQYLAFLADGKLKKVALADGGIQTIADLKTYVGGCWVSDDAIVIAIDRGLVRIPAAGGVPVPLTEIDRKGGETFHAAGTPLRDGRHFFYYRGSGSGLSRAGLYLGRIDAAPNDQSLTKLNDATSSVVYATDEGGGNGRLLFVSFPDGYTMAQAFDAQRLELVGDPVRVPGMDAVHHWQGVAALSASANGTVAYRRASSEQVSPVFVSRDGKELGSIATDLERAEHPRVSPDGKSLALVVASDVWRYDLDGRPPTKLTFDGGLSPVWSRDGRRIVYEGGGTLRSVPSDGSGKPEDVAPKGHFHPHSITPDAREIVAVQLGEGGSLVRLALQPEAKPESIAKGGFSAALSPDGRWLAYIAETTGAQEIWVRPFPGPGAPIRVSPNRGAEPVWAKNGRELFYLQDDVMMAVAVDTTNGFNFKPAVRLFETSYLRTNQPPSYDVTADGRFIMLKPKANMAEPITVILNWGETLRSGAR